jgi:serine O-acetyltransferase
VNCNAGGGIGAGLVICHGHGTVILAEKIGKNFTCFQGVTIGKNPRHDQDGTMPIIGDNVTAYTNSVIVGPITIADNVKFSAGTVCMQDVSANAVVYGNPCSVKYKT